MTRPEYREVLFEGWSLWKEGDINKTVQNFGFFLISLKILFFSMLC